MKIIVEPYNSDWEQDFARESTDILGALRGFAPLIQHIGSTSVRGLSAKPIIDCMLGFTTLEELHSIIPFMQSIGYSYVSKYEDVMPYRRYFVRYRSEVLPYIPEVDSETPDMWLAGYQPLVHVHSVVVDSEFWERHLAFRDYLRLHPNERSRYGNFKQNLALQEWASSLDYSSAKHDFIQDMEQVALNWYRTRKE